MVTFKRCKRQHCQPSVCSRTRDKQPAFTSTELFENKCIFFYVCYNCYKIIYRLRAAPVMAVIVFMVFIRQICQSWIEEQKTCIYGTLLNHLPLYSCLKFQQFFCYENEVFSFNKWLSFATIAFVPRRNVTQLLYSLRGSFLVSRKLCSDQQFFKSLYFHQRKATKIIT